LGREGGGRVCVSDFLFLLDGRQAVRLSVAHFDEFGVLQFVAALGAQQPRRVKQRHQRQRVDYDGKNDVEVEAGGAELERLHEVVRDLQQQR